ncbi:DUF1345 domain-containing protein [Aquabacter sp. CN5-332]|uniref:DUF1345 domain-containing protein n=1 Tax=Aquabacter sp. CN5-332 TaxID=3156608 RepID=UPI0032B421E7
MDAKVATAVPAPVHITVPWIARRHGRILAALVAGAGTALATLTLPLPLQIVATFDVAALTYVALFFCMANMASPEEAAELSRQRESIGRQMLVLAVLMSLISLLAVPALQISLKDTNGWLEFVHLTASLLALFLSWTLMQIFFCLEYMCLHYDDDDPAAGERGVRRLDFPSRPVPDFWDFMYFSFTVAMCYATSDVTINGHSLRRLTTLHAIFSFFYVIMIIGLVVSILDDAV